LPSSSSGGWIAVRLLVASEECTVAAEGRGAGRAEVVVAAWMPAQKVVVVDGGARQMWSKMSVKRRALMGFWASMRFMEAMDGTKNI
jgi:hypothetical protein